MQNNQYSINWFKKRALESIKPLGVGSWDFSDSLLLYMSESVKVYEEMQKDETPYHELVTKPETEYILRVAGRVASELPNNFYYIDLGPGTENKERFFFESLKMQGKNFIYFPVDISSHFLDVAKNFAVGSDIKTNPILASFEECEKYLPVDDTYRFASLGLTFVNYHIQDILSLLNRIIGLKGSAFINAHIRERVDIEKIRNLYYVDATESMIIPKIELLNLKPEDIGGIEVNDKVEIWCTIKNPTPALAQMGIKSGDRFLVFQSLRYSLDYLKNEIPKTFPNYSMLDTGLPFVGFLLKK